MKNAFLTLCLFLASGVYLLAQNEIPWDGKYQLQLSDFQSPATRIGNVNIYSMYGGATFDFAERHIAAATATELGHDREKLNVLHQQVLTEIEAYAEFCRECKPKKKKKS
jgi:hypothetical protein